MSDEVSAWVVDPSAAPVPTGAPDVAPEAWADACARAFTDRDPICRARKEQEL